MFDEFKYAFQRPNNGHIQLIIINVVVFLILAVLWVFSSLSNAPDLFATIHAQLAIPAEFSRFIQKPWTIITYAFVHDLRSIWHILFNMMAFYWFGKLIVEYLGNDKLIALYILGAIAGAAVYLLGFNTIDFLNHKFAMSSLVGASGAVFAVMVAAATLLPDYTFFLMFFGAVKIKYIALVFIVISFLGITQENALGDVAHLGGALMGFIYVKQLQAGVNWGGWITAVLDFIKGLFKPRPKVKITYRETEPKKKTAAGFSKATQQEIDMILDKISDRGYESLSKEEKEKLFNASNKQQ